MNNSAVPNLIKSMLEELAASLEGKSIVTSQRKRQAFRGL